jgi:hypothetical protein
MPCHSLRCSLATTNENSSCNFYKFQPDFCLMRGSCNECQICVIMFNFWKVTRAPQTALPNFASCRRVSMLQEFYPTNKVPYFCNITLCVTFLRMPDALTIFLYNRPFFNITHHSEAPRGYVPESIEEDTCKLIKWQNSVQYCNMLLASTLCILISGMLCWIVLQTLTSYFTLSRVLWHF